MKKLENIISELVSMNRRIANNFKTEEGKELRADLFDITQKLEHYKQDQDLQLQQTGVSGSFYEIKIDKEDSEIINEKLFEPKIQKFLDSTSVCCYLNFPKNWANWELPKRLHKKDLKIISFDKTKIVVGW